MKKVVARNSILVMAMLAVSVVGGCKKKKQQPQVAQAPTVAVPQTTSPAQQSPTANNGSSSNPNEGTAQPAQSTKPQTAQTQPKPKPKSKPAKPSAAHRIPNPEPPADKSGTANGNTTIATNVPPKITIETNAPDVGGAISATGPHSDDLHDKLTTEQL